MKITSLLAALIMAMTLVACGEKAEEAPVEAPAAEATPAPAAPAPSAGGGGYEPSADERVPGITMSQEELDKVYEAAKADMPAVEVPGEAKPE
jgi:predicted small lipoprotein YifL